MRIKPREWLEKTMAYRNMDLIEEEKKWREIWQRRNEKAAHSGK